MTLDEFSRMDTIRSTDLMEFGRHIEEGGQIPPMTFFEEEW